VTFYQHIAYLDDFPVDVVECYGQREMGAGGEAGYIIMRDLTPSTGHTVMGIGLTLAQAIQVYLTLKI
jgi:hypothetical protein